MFLIGGSSWGVDSAEVTFDGKAGDDTISGGAGNDGLIIGDHNPFTGTISGPGGDDVLRGGTGGDCPACADREFGPPRMAARTP